MPVTQYPMRLPDRRHSHRLRLARLKLAVEVDHPAWHDGELDSHADKGRDRKLATIGWTSTRITNIDVNGGLREAVADIGRILASSWRLRRLRCRSVMGARQRLAVPESRPVGFPGRDK